MKVTIKECEYREDGLCLRYLANGTGDVEPCDYCNAEEIIAVTVIAEAGKIVIVKVEK